MLTDAKVLTAYVFLKENFFFCVNPILVTVGSFWQVKAQLEKQEL